MGVNKEYVCFAHGPFESADEPALCPKGCDTVQRIFLNAPAVGSSRTKNIDATLQRFANQYGLSNMSNRGGKAVRGPDPNFVKGQQEVREYLNERYGRGWGAIPKGATYNASTGAVEQVAGRTGDGVAAAFNEYGGKAENNLANVKPNDLALGVSPKPIKAIRDPQNLQMADARPEQHVKQRAA